MMNSERYPDVQPLEGCSEEIMVSSLEGDTASSYLEQASCFRIIFVSDGTATVLLNRQPVALSRGDLVLVPLDTDLKYRTSDALFAGHLVMFSEQVFFRMDNETRLLYDFAFINNSLHVNVLAKEKVMELLECLFLWINAELLAEDTLRLKKMTVFKMVGLILLQFYYCSECASFEDSLEPGQNESYRILIMFLELLSLNIYKHHTVQFYADKMEMPVEKLKEQVEKMTGKAPKTIINQKLINEAKKQLHYSDMSVKEIGSYLGFSHTTNFVKFFRTNMQQSPGVYRLAAKRKAR